jgi:tripartite-type tricarboxylate transporter receptor subunit TctC
MRSRLLGILISASVAFTPLALSSAHAEYPDPMRRITFIVPFSAGGSNDILSRVIGQKLSEAWKIPVIIENQVGASGAVGTLRVARAAPDGYTLLILSSTYTINAAVMEKLPYDPKTSFAPVALLGRAPMMLAASKMLAAQNAKDLIALARARPGSLNYGSAGVGSVNHMAMELLKSLGHLDIQHAPYRAGNAAVNDLIGGHIDLFVGSLPQMMELARAGNATAIAVTSTKRAASVPDVPTIAESGVPDYELEQWWGLVVPAGTPPEIINKLNATLNQILATPEVVAFMEREGAKPTSSTPEEFGRHLAAELQRWTDLIAHTGLKVQ